MAATHGRRDSAESAAPASVRAPARPLDASRPELLLKRHAKESILHRQEAAAWWSRIAARDHGGRRFPVC
jgi:hypothetical protein